MPIFPPPAVFLTPSTAITRCRATSSPQGVIAWRDLSVARYLASPPTPPKRPRLLLTGSGLLLRSEFAACDAGSAGLDRDEKKNAACRCGEILMGKAEPVQCPLFGKVCTPDTPQGACMVSAEGSCAAWYRHGRGKTQKPAGAGGEKGGSDA